METLLKPCNLFWLCFLLHLVADYTLQGILCDLKQQGWWFEQLKKLAYKTNDTEKQDRLFAKYSHDYISGLICHAAMWSILTFLPLMFVCSQLVFAVVVVCNLAIHCLVDHLKANKRLINLNQDQALHLLQIVATLVVVYYI